MPYAVSGYDPNVLPSLDATLRHDGEAAAATLHAAFRAATAAAAQ